MPVQELVSIHFLWCYVMASKVPPGAKVDDLYKEKGEKDYKNCQWSELFDGKTSMSIFSSSSISQSTWGYFVCSKWTASLLLSHWFPDCLVLAQQLNLTELRAKTILCCAVTSSLGQTWPQEAFTKLQLKQVWQWSPGHQLAVEKKWKSVQAKTGISETETLLCHVSMKPKFFY